MYSNKKSRPNVAVNQLVSSLILKHLFNWTYKELFRNLNFNILTRHAIGIESLTESVFSEASIFNFQNKVINYFVQTGTDLLTNVFDSLTTNQLKEFGIKTNIQRGDSFLIGSNIFDYTRVQLLIEVVNRMYKILSKEDKKIYSEFFEAYRMQTSGQYIFKVKNEDLPKEIKKLANVFHKLHTILKDKYRETSMFQIFERVYLEHFIIIEDKIEIIPTTELSSESILSPDDIEATYRIKRRKVSKGYVGHLSETANPDNDLNLITDIVVAPNNVDDAKILEGRLPKMKDKTPELNEYHADGGYGSPKVDEIMEENNIRLIQTSIRGRKAAALMTISEEQKNQYWVECEFGQKIKAEKLSKSWKVIFDSQECANCKLKDICATKKFKGKKGTRSWYFTEEKIRLHKRKDNYHSIPEERKKIRANVEATVKEAKRGIKNGKVRLRGMERIRIYMSMTSLAINMIRIHKFVFINVLSSFFAYTLLVAHCANEIKQYEIKLAK